MKKTIQYIFLTAFLVFSTAISLNAQPHAGSQDGGGTVPGDRIGAAAGAPIGSGSLILLTLAVAYGTIKVYSFRTVQEVE